MNEEWKIWENQIAEQRLLARHNLALARQKRTHKKTWKLKAEAAAIGKHLEFWQYKPSLQAPTIEVAWIIHSQLAWKGREVTNDELWEDLPFTDPIEIMRCEGKGPESGSPIPDEKLYLLKRVLDELEEHGENIKDKEFSKNWRFGSPNSTPGRNIKKPKEKKLIKKKWGSGILNGFFGGTQRQ